MGSYHICYFVKRQIQYVYVSTRNDYITNNMKITYLMIKYGNNLAYVRDSVDNKTANKGKECYFFDVLTCQWRSRGVALSITYSVSIT